MIPISTAFCGVGGVGVSQGQPHPTGGHVGGWGMEWTHYVSSHACSKERRRFVQLFLLLLAALSPIKAAKITTACLHGSRPETPCLHDNRQKACLIILISHYPTANIHAGVPNLLGRHLVPNLLGRQFLLF